MSCRCTTPLKISHFWSIIQWQCAVSNRLKITLYLSGYFQFMTMHIFTIGITLLLLIYHQATTLLPLFPWNDVEKYSRKELLLEAGTNGLLMGCGALCIIKLAIPAFFITTRLFITPSFSAVNFFNGGCPIFLKSLQNRKPILIMKPFFHAPQNWSRTKPASEHLMPIISSCIL